MHIYCGKLYMVANETYVANEMHGGFLPNLFTFRILCTLLRLEMPANSK